MFQNLALKRSSFLSIPARLGIMLVLLFIALALMPALVARADDIIVNNTDDSGTGSLRQAIANANPGDTIIITATGTITLTTGQLEIINTMTINGPGAGNLSISGDNASRVITITNGIAVTITGVTIRDGRVSTSNGGGIYNRGTLFLNATDIVSNSSSASVPEGFGGGIFNAAGGTLIMYNTTIATNTANRRGGGIYSAGTLAVTNSEIDSNKSNFGGGIYNIDGPASIANSTISNNQAIAANGNGGGIAHNTETAAGTMTIRNSTVSGNTAYQGGGIRNIGGGGFVATMVISGSTISGNTASNDGGGFYNETVNEPAANSAVLVIVNSTVADNISGNDGGGISIEVDTTLHITNIIIADNTDVSGAGVNYPDIDINGVLISHGYNLVGNRGDEGTYPSSTGDQVGEPGSIIDPRLGPLADNGGDTWTHALLAGSPAIDAGSCSGTTTDQRGYPRPVDFVGVANVDDGCDSGAYEAQAELVLVKTVDDDTPDPGQLITFTITVDNRGILTATNGLVSDTLDSSNFTFAGPITLDPPGAGTEGTTTPTLASGLTITPGQRITITFPVTVSTGLPGGTVITNTAAVTSTEVVTPQTGSVGIMVNNVAPVAVDDSTNNTNEEAPLTINVLANDTDLNGDTLSVVTVGTPNFGSVAVSGTAQVVYTPTNRMAGYDAVFTYTVSDGSLTDTATVTVTVSADNDAPDAVDDPTNSTNEDTPLTISVLANDSDPEGVSLTVSAVGTPNFGDTSTDGTAVTYTPTNRTADYDAVFTYTVSDGVLTDIATVTVTVTADNDAPVANDDSGTGYITDEDTPFTTGNVLDNDDDPEGDTLSVVSTSGTLGLVTDNGNGTFDFDPRGMYDYLAAGEQGFFYFTYVVSDGTLTDTATVTITINGVNDAPVANDDSGTGYITDEDTPFTTGNVLDNDDDPEGDTLSVVSTSGTLGLVIDNGDGTFDFDPRGLSSFNSLDVGEQGIFTFTYTVSDGALTDSATVTITIHGVNDPPVAVDDSGTGYITDEDTPFTTGNVLDNDDDPENDTLSVVSTSGTLGLVIDNGDGTFDFDPRGLSSFNSLDVGEQGIFTFTYTVSDGALTDSATVTITIHGVNDPPVAVDDSGTGYITDEDTPFTTANVLSNDTDPENNPLSVKSTSGTLGLVIDNGDGTFNFDPRGLYEYLGTGEQAFFSFTYVVSDGTLDDTGAVTLTINGVNDSPVAVDDSYIAVYETTLNVPVATGVLTNDLDVEGDTLTAFPSSPPVGTLNLNPDGSFIYTPTTGFTGTDTFTYHANDGLADSNVATVTINVLLATDADMEMSKSVDDATPNEGGTVVYTLQVTNNGPADATGVVISDTLPSGVSYVSDDGGGNYDENIGAWNVGNLDASAITTLHITATVGGGTAGTTITNTAVISVSDQADPITANDQADAAITVTGLPTGADLEMSKSVDDATPHEGGTVVYTLQMTNNGPADATGVVVSDTLPSGVSYVSDDGGGDYDESTGAWTVGNLNDGVSVTLHITVTVDAGTVGNTITNTAVISASDQADPVSGNDEDNATITVAEYRIYLPLVTRNN